jgi:hypothetical protein
MDEASRMKPRLIAAWTLYRMTQSVLLAACAFALVVALCVWILIERSAAEEELGRRAETVAAAEASAIADPQPDLLHSWRQRLTVEAARLPPRKDALAIIRTATGLLEASGVSIDSVNTSHSTASGMPFGTVMVEARMTGSAVLATSALSEILATSPGWSIERISIERQAEGIALIEALMVLLYANGS